MWPNRQASKDYPWVHYIHPLKQRQVEEMVKTLSQHDDVEYAIVFGSTVTSSCNIDSDIDVLLKGNQRISFPKCDVFDVINADAVKKYTPLWNDIYREGVLVYDRDKVE